MLGDLELAGRIVLALALGAIIGWEREHDEEPAGLRTHMLVILGATLFTIMSFSISGTADPSRVAAGIVTGIGFLGAGAIFRAENKIKGLTTAADLWVLAAIGMAVGIGYYVAAIVSAVLVFAILYIKRVWGK